MPNVIPPPRPPWKGSRSIAMICGLIEAGNYENGVKAGNQVFEVPRKMRFLACDAVDKYSHFGQPARQGHEKLSMARKFC